MATARTELFLCFGVLIGSASAGLARTEPGALSADDLRDAHCIEIVDPPAFGLWGGEVPAIGTYALTPPGAGYCGAAGALDVVISSTNAADRVCRGEGDGTFSACEDVGSPPVAAKEVAAGTIDGDSIPDVVFAVGSGANRFCAGDGAGGFSHCTDADPADLDTSSVALGFVDGDPHLDAIFGNTGSFVPDERRNRVCLGNGDGTFTPCTNVSLDDNYSNDVELGLLDDDPHLDAVFANTLNGRNRVCLGNGDGTFTCEDIGDDENDSSGIALADFGDPDIFADGFESGDTSAWATTVP